MTPYPKPVLDAVDKTTETVKKWFNKNPLKNNSIQFDSTKDNK